MGVGGERGWKGAVRVEGAEGEEGREMGGRGAEGDDE